MGVTCVTKKVEVKPAAHERKQLSKWPGKAVCSAVSSRVRRSFRENFATSVQDGTNSTFSSSSARKIEKKKPLSQSLQSPLVFYPCF